ncbi:MAG: DUF2232 domain-containing protein [Candidatus Hydrogenedentes bacterium]|nr:DUF2232 domain-containing protein [Candidatus Hydrogenedentota bacterium]
MMLYAAIWLALLALSGGITLVAGPNALGFAIFIVPVAVYMARGRRWPAAGLVACAGLAALLAILGRGALLRLFAPSGEPWLREGTVQGSLLTGLYFALEAGTGLILGVGLARRWPYGRIVALVTTVCFSVALVNDVLAWDVWKAQAEASFEAFGAQFRRMAQEPGAGEAAARQLDAWTWLQGHWPYLAFGLNLSIILCAACVAVSLTAKLARQAFGGPVPTGSFREMRPSEWLVWAAIAVAVLWFVDQKWPSDPVRMIVWNSAIGLGAVYWLNGLSLFLYGVRALRPNMLVYAVVVLAMVYAGLVPVLCCIGLFDTWGDFRRKVDALVAARNAQNGPGDGES